MATCNWYGLAVRDFFSTTSTRKVDWVGDTIQTALLTASYTPAQNTHQFWSDVSANEISGTGYTAKGVTLGTKSINYATGTKTVQLIAANAAWTGASFTARYGIVFKDTGTAGTSPLMGYVDLGGAQTVASGTFTIQWDATDGVLRLVVA